MVILHNSQFIQREEALTDIEDRGYTFGDGVYEVIRIYHGSFFMLDEHLKRLQYGLNEINISYNIQKEQLKSLLLELKDRNQVKDGGIYLQISRGIAPRKHPYPPNAKPVLYAYPIPIQNPASQQENGVKLMLVEDLRWLRCDIKSINLLYNVMAKQKALEAGAFEALLYRDENHITEGSSTNFFGIKDGSVVTHPADHFILNGITRKAVQQICHELEIPFVEKRISIDELSQLDEAFLASTTAEIVPVIQINDEVIGEGTVGNLVKQIQLAFRKLMK